MTTPSPKDDDQQKAPKAGAAPPDSKSGEASIETKTGLWAETPTSEMLNRDPSLSEELSAQEKVQAKAALGFLNEIRSDLKQSQTLPQRIGRYSIVRSLGRGGFAEVFLAHDEELDRAVALKIPLFHADLNSDARLRFEREARVAASLGHPQIVPVYEYGDVGPVRFIAFAWCDGPTMAEWIEHNGAVDARTAAQIVAHLADAVQHAHQRGIVHRDLKPGNVLVDDASDSSDEPIWKQVRITDFGLAKQTNVKDTTLTLDGQIIGTPAYMAPEQAGGKDEAGPAADVWALGMILFELLTGQTPFRRPDLFNTIRAICEEPVPRARAIRRDVPAGLDAIADFCLRKKPEDRYESAHDLSVDLRRWLDDEPVKARPVSAVTKMALWAKRNPLLSSALALALVSLTVGLGVSLWQRNVALENLSLVKAQTTRADKNLEMAQTLINDVIELEKQFRNETKFVKQRSVLVKRASELQLELVQDERATPRIRYDTAMTLRGLTELLNQLGDYKGALGNANGVLALLDGLESELSDEKMQSEIYQTRFKQRIRMASMFNFHGKQEEAKRLFEANDAEIAPAGMTPFYKATLLAENLRAQAFSLQMTGDWAGAIPILLKASGYLTEAGVPEDPKDGWNYHLSLCRLHTLLSMAQTELGNLNESESEFLSAEQSLLQMRALKPDHPIVDQTASTLAWSGGNLYHRIGKSGLAVKQYQKCREVNLAMFHSNPAVINTANVYILASLSLAKTYASNESFDLAEKVATETIAKAGEFPDALKATGPFKDNMKLLDNFITTE